MKDDWAKQEECKTLVSITTKRCLYSTFCQIYPTQRLIFVTRYLNVLMDLVSRQTIVYVVAFAMH